MEQQQQLNVDGDIVDDGCCTYREVLGGGVTLEEGFGGKVGVQDGVVNEGSSSTTGRTRMVHTDSKVVGEGVGL